ncbi:MAG: hypothetical protein R3C11_29565 [Planctomycetaceae bacterium]
MRTAKEEECLKYAKETREERQIAQQMRQQLVDIQRAKKTSDKKLAAARDILANVALDGVVDRKKLDFVMKNS